MPERGENSPNVWGVGVVCGRSAYSNNVTAISINGVIFRVIASIQFQLNELIEFHGIGTRNENGIVVQIDISNAIVLTAPATQQFNIDVPVYTATTTALQERQVSGIGRIGFSVDGAVVSLSINRTRHNAYFPRYHILDPSICDNSLIDFRGVASVRGNGTIGGIDLNYIAPLTGPSGLEEYINLESIAQIPPSVNGERPGQIKSILTGTLKSSYNHREFVELVVITVDKAESIHVRVYPNHCRIPEKALKHGDIITIQHTARGDSDYIIAELITLVPLFEYTPKGFSVNTLLVLDDLVEDLLELHASTDLSVNNKDNLTHIIDRVRSVIKAENTVKMKKPKKTKTRLLDRLTANGPVEEMPLNHNGFSIESNGSIVHNSGAVTITPPDAATVTWLADAYEQQRAAIATTTAAAIAAGLRTTIYQHNGDVPPEARVYG